MIIGAAGTFGVAVRVFESPLTPIEFFARITTEYEVPLVRPEIVNVVDVEAGLRAIQVPLPLS